jgi:hypothetical protein
VEPHELILLALATGIDREAVLRGAYEVRHERMVMAARGLVGLAATILVSPWASLWSGTSLRQQRGPSSSLPLGRQLPEWLA